MDKKWIPFVVISISVTIMAMPWQDKIYKISIPTYNQHEYGYPRGCEGVSLYMALRGKGYVKDLSLSQFMDTMPLTSEDPHLGYVGNPCVKLKTSGVNKGKRTTIYPEPLAKWGSQYGFVENISGQSIEQLKAQLRQGNPVIVYMTSHFNEPQWKQYSWGRSVTNNHALCLVGYSKHTEQYLVNDCGQNSGEYWVKKYIFEKIYEARKFAVVVK